MTVEVGDELSLALRTAGFGEEATLLSMHLSEIEAEAGAILDLLTASRSHAHRKNKPATQETLAELAIALEHFLHHATDALPALQKELDIE